MKCVQQSAIIYANTVAKAVEFYDWFKANTKLEPMLYHSRFTEPDKLEKERILLENLGHEAWKKGTANGVAILTQIGEMSINISADLMISDICPIDRLVQRAGRLCRFDKEKIGALYILIPQQKGAVYPAPYGSFDRRLKAWKISPSLNKTIKSLQLKKYSANDFVNFINDVYEKLEDFTLRAKENAKLLKENFAYNWVILPKAISELDDTETVFWKSRDIDNNISVLTEFPENPYFNNYMDWQAFKNEKAVNLPIYLVQQGIKLFKIDQNRKIVLKEDTQNVLCTYKGVYTKEKGLFFSKKTNMDDNFL